jgi:hypothetical protein
VKLPPKFRNSLTVFFILFNSMFLFPIMARAEDIPPAVTTIVTPGGDDVSYHIPLTVSVVYDGVTYENVYATTNSVITFGRPDGTYWDYPVTPSISIESRDWWALPQQMPDTHFILNVSDGGFQVDGTYRPYGTFTGNTTSIIITAQIQTDGTVAYTYAVDGPLSGNERTGARLVDGTIVTLEEAGVIQVEQAPVLEPEPVPPVVDPLPEPTPEPQPQPEPSPRPVPVYEPPVQPSEPEPAPEETPEPPAEETPAPVIPEPEAESPPIVDPAPEPVEEAPAVVEPVEESTPSEPPIVNVEDVNLESLPPDTPVKLANGVVVTAQVAMAVEMLQNPAEFVQTMLTNPIAALADLGSVGADLPPEVREEAEKVVVAAIIAGNIATQAAATAAASAVIRRKP